MAIAPFTFLHSTRRVIFGWDSLVQLDALAKERGLKRPAAVIDEYFAGTALQDRLRDILTRATGTEPVFHAIPSYEPDAPGVEACAATLASANPDFIVAVGGGSTMDAAKVARMLLSNPGPAAAIAGFGMRMAPHASLLVAVPTTAGSGAEVSESAVIGLDGSDVKLIYRSQEMTAEVALLDPALSVSAPRQVTAFSGYDAVTHAVEAYVSNKSSPMTDPYAVSAMELLARWLVTVCEQPDHREARSACLIASMQAAIAFNSANLGLAHAISGPLSAQQHVAHGLGNALALPHSIAFNEAASNDPVLGDKCRRIAEIFGGATASKALAALRHRVGLDVSLDEFVKTDADRERLAQWAIKSGQVATNPRPTTIADMHGILQAMRAPSGG